MAQPVQHSFIGELAFIMFGVSAFAVIANGSEELGKVLLTLMVGWLLVWFMLHADVFSAIMDRIQSLGSPTNTSSGGRPTIGNPNVGLA